jgi:hypothetical protein
MALRIARGLFRLWIVGTALFVLGIAFVSYSDIKAEFDAVASMPKPPGPSSLLANFRQRHPLSACNARPVHTEVPIGDITRCSKLAPVSAAILRLV